MEIESFYYKDLLKFILGTHGNETWVIIYKKMNDPATGQRGSFYSALIEKDKTADALKRPSWDLTLGQGMPGFITHYENGNEVTEYHTNASYTSCEPIVRYREFHGVKENYLEISEEIRLYHNLYYDHARNKCITFDESGEEIDVIICSEEEIKIRKRYLKEFMSAKQMDLLLFFDITQFDSVSESEHIDLSAYSEQNSSNSFIYTRNAGHLSLGDNRIFSRLLGKKVVFCEKQTKSGVFPYEKQRIYQEYIIRENEDGEEITHTSNPDELADYFGGNPDAPHYLTPVFFKKMFYQSITLNLHYIQ